MSKIVTVPDPVLRQMAKPVAKADKKLVDIVAEMTTTLLSAKNPEGVGLAAPQVGIPLRIFLIRPNPELPPQVFINPEIIKYSQRTVKPNRKSGVYEGCLSLPGHYSPVTRSASVTVKYQKLVQNSKSKSQNSNQTPNSNLKIEKLGINSDIEISNLKLTEKIEVFTGFPAHIIQHEMDHLNGILFIDRVLEQNAKLYRVEGDDWREISL